MLVIRTLSRSGARRMRGCCRSHARTERLSPPLVLRLVVWAASCSSAEWRLGIDGARVHVLTQLVRAISNRTRYLRLPGVNAASGACRWSTSVNPPPLGSRKRDEGTVTKPSRLRHHSVGLGAVRSPSSRSHGLQPELARRSRRRARFSSPPDLLVERPRNSPAGVVHTASVHVGSAMTHRLFCVAAHALTGSRPLPSRHRHLRRTAPHLAWPEGCDRLHPLLTFAIYSQTSQQRLRSASVSSPGLRPSGSNTRRQSTYCRSASWRSCPRPGTHPARWALSRRGSPATAAKPSSIALPYLPVRVSRSHSDSSACRRTWRNCSRPMSNHSSYQSGSSSPAARICSRSWSEALEASTSAPARRAAGDGVDRRAPQRPVTGVGVLSTENG